MRVIPKIAALGLVVALGACQSADRFGTGVGGGPGGMAGVGAAGNPTSPAYFQSEVGDRVHFAVDQHTLSPEAQATLDAQAAWLGNNPEFTGMIEGHADEQGTQEYNLRLSERRATSAMEYLISRGVAPSRLSMVGYGKLRPLAICSTEDCYRQNRRAVTVLQAGPVS